MVKKGIVPLYKKGNKRNRKVKAKLKATPESGSSTVEDPNPSFPDPIQGCRPPDPTCPDFNPCPMDRPGVPLSRLGKAEVGILEHLERVDSGFGLDVPLRLGYQGQRMNRRRDWSHLDPVLTQAWAGWSHSAIEICSLDNVLR
ncbi:hypothetical protein CDAR_233681 [Caerostris darwini]|uniref:Uncharacterized protein n=1 Tax=Caerostris darwini TaxID=1538125 RepID=A0AAV4PTD2_9ARAC|nr:hypothetical protein CDAR_233681 [Caerostris darwini]